MTKKIFVMGQEITIEEEAQTQGILVYAEIAAQKLTDISTKALKAARIIADKIGTRVSALAIGENIKDSVDKLSSAGADNVITKDEKKYKEFNPSLFAEALLNVAQKENPEVILFGHSPGTVDVAARTAQALKTGLVTKCIDLDVDLERRLLIMKRAIYNGILAEELICSRTKPQMATIS